MFPYYCKATLWVSTPLQCPALIYPHIMWTTLGIVLGHIQNFLAAQELGSRAHNRRSGGRDAAAK
jgi:hypothetical protein